MTQFKLIKKHKLDKLSVDDLRALSSELSEYVTLKEVEDAKQEFEAILKAKGLKPGDVYPGMTATPAKLNKPKTKPKAKPKDGRGSAPEVPKYKHPETGETWKKGKIANWVKAICDERGITKEDFMASAEFLNPEHPNYEEFKKAAEAK